MALKLLKSETQVLGTLQEMTAIARSAKRIEEISDSMSNLAIQANLTAMEALALSQDLAVLARLQGSVAASKQDLAEQFNLLLEEISELHQMMCGKVKEINISETDLN